MALKGKELEMDIQRDGLLRAGIELVFKEIETLETYEEHYSGE